MVRFAFQIIKNTEIPSVVLTCENQKYIFNVPETFQRYNREHYLRINSGPTFFFTRSSPEVSSGIIGMMLTLYSESQSIGTKLYGPSQLGDLFNMLRYSEVAGFKTFPFSYYDLELQKTRTLGIKNMNHIDHIIKRADLCYIKDQIEACKQVLIDKDIPVMDQNNSSDLIKERCYFEDENLTIIPIVLQQKQNQTNVLQEINNNDDTFSDTCIQYIVNTKNYQGNVLPEKIAEYKLTKSQLPILFKKGSLLLDDGQIIYESDIRQKNCGIKSIIILDIINENTLLEFIEHQQFRNLINKIDNQEIQLICIIHMGKSEIIQQISYQNFINRFQNVDHVFCNIQQQKKINEQIDNRKHIIRSLQVCDQLNQYFPDNFPIVNSQKISAQLFQQNNLIGYENLYEYIILPQLKRYQPINGIDYDNLHKSIQFKPEMDIILEKIQNDLKSKISTDERSLIFLGTGSMKPGKYRNVSSILIKLVKCNILLDCGEGTYKQLIDQNVNICEKPLIIWISHAHSDHHLGMLNLMFQYLQNQSQHQIYLVIPSIMVSFIYYYNKSIQQAFKRVKIVMIQQFENLNSFDIQQQLIEDFDYQRIRDGSIEKIKQHEMLSLVMSVQMNFEQLKFYLSEELKISEFQQIKVDHCPQAYGIAIQWMDGFKLTYSGDTRPNKNFISCSDKANIMIHEATFSDDLQENAIQNMHSTIREAVESAIESNSQNLVLTHFSQRFAKSAIKNTKQKLSPKILTELHKYTDEEYQQYLTTKSIYAVDHLKGQFDEYQNLVEMSHLIGQLIKTDE